VWHTPVAQELLALSQGQRKLGEARLDSGQIASGVRGVFVLVEKSIIIAYCEGTRLRHCARSRKVARSMPDGVTDKVLSTALWSCGWLRL
jgi:hypothetical protein